MGDTIWSAFKDGISIYSEAFGATLVVPELVGTPWCKKDMLDDLEELLDFIDEAVRDPTIILSGTSMGGSIALTALMRERVRTRIAGVISTSATTRLDLLAQTTTSKLVRETIIASTDFSHPSDQVLRQQSLHYSLPRLKIPMAVLFSEDDATVPPAPVLETAELLRAQGTPIKLIRMPRPSGHYRPLQHELAEAYAWIVTEIKRDDHK